MIDDSELEGLIAGVAAGDRDDFRSLYGVLSGLLYGVCLRVLRDPPAAQESLQDAFVKIWANAHRYDPDKGRAVAWTLTIARRCAIDRARREGARPAPVDLDAATLTYQETGDDAANQDLRRCLAGLEARTRRIIELAFVYGLTHGELAEMLGRPLGTVKSWIRRGLGALRRCLADDG